MAKKYIADNFIKSGGTSTQVLMADGNASELSTINGESLLGGENFKTFTTDYYSDSAITVNSLWYDLNDSNIQRLDNTEYTSGQNNLSLYNYNNGSDISNFSKTTGEISDGLDTTRANYSYSNNGTNEIMYGGFLNKTGVATSTGLITDILEKNVNILNNGNSIIESSEQHFNVDTDEERINKTTTLYNNGDNIGNFTKVEVRDEIANTNTISIQSVLANSGYSDLLYHNTNNVTNFDESNATLSSSEFFESSLMNAGNDLIKGYKNYTYDYTTGDYTDSRYVYVRNNGNDILGCQYDENNFGLIENKTWICDGNGATFLHYEDDTTTIYGPSGSQEAKLVVDGDISGNTFNGVKLYKAMLISNGESTPITATTFANSFGEDIDWNTSEPTSWGGFLDGAFPPDKTFLQVSTSKVGATCSIELQGDSTIVIELSSVNSLTKVYVTIEVYPY